MARMSNAGFILSTLEDMRARRQPRTKMPWSRRTTAQDIENAAALEALDDVVARVKRARDSRDLGDTLLALGGTYEKDKALPRDVRNGKAHIYGICGLICHQVFDPRA